MQNPIVVFGSHGNSEKVAKLLPHPRQHAENKPVHKEIIFVIPNRGDEELPESVEEFIEALPAKGEFAICELGNYFGYELEEFGAATVLRRVLEDKGWRAIIDTLPLDSLPEINMPLFDEWKEKLQCLIDTSSN